MPCDLSNRFEGLAPSASPSPSPSPSLTPTSSFPASFQCYKPHYHKVYGSVCMSPSNRVLVVKGRRSGKWSFPKGHKKGSESYLDCARRETMEETGIPLTPFPPIACHKFFAGEYFFFELPEETTPQPRDSAEIEEAAWMTLDELRALRSGGVNVDINYFLDRMRRGRRYPDAPESSWRPAPTPPVLNI